MNFYKIEKACRPVVPAVLYGETLHIAGNGSHKYFLNLVPPPLSLYQCLGRDSIISHQNLSGLLPDPHPIPAAVMTICKIHPGHENFSDRPPPPPALGSSPGALLEKRGFQESDPCSHPSRAPTRFDFLSGLSHFPSLLKTHLRHHRTVSTSFSGLGLCFSAFPLV